MSNQPSGEYQVEIQQMDLSGNPLPSLENRSPISFEEGVSQYNTLMMEYKQLVTDYANASLTTLVTLDGYSYDPAKAGETGVTTVTNVDTKEACRQKCDDSDTCQGATFDMSGKKCILSPMPFLDVSFNVTPDDMGNFVAILPQKKALLVKLRDLNMKLQEKVQYLIDFEFGGSNLDMMQERLNGPNKKLFEEKLAKLQEEEEKMKLLDKQLNSNEEKEKTSQREIRRNYYTFLVYGALLVLIVVIYFWFFSGGKATSASSSTFSSASFAQPSGMMGGGRLSGSAWTWLLIASAVSWLFFHRELVW